MVENTDEYTDYDELEPESYECYSCGWMGEDPFSQGSTLFDGDEDLFLCPICGNLIN